MRILIAEGDAMLAEALRCTLRRSGYAVDWVGDGAEADAALGATEFDLLILDISLPELDGFEVLRRLRARDSRLPVLWDTIGRANYGRGARGRVGGGSMDIPSPR